MGSGGRNIYVDMVITASELPTLSLSSPQKEYADVLLSMGAAQSALEVTSILLYIL